jgi:hypothetical protein
MSRLTEPVVWDSSGSMYYRKGTFRDVLGRFG